MLAGVLSIAMIISATPGTSQQVNVADGRTPRMAFADTLLAKPVTLTLDHVPLRQAIDAVAAAGQVIVTYRRDALSAESRSVTLRSVKMPLGEAFTYVLRGTALRLIPLPGGQFAIVPSSNGKVDDGIIVGTIVDAATKRPVVGATVTVEGTKVAVRTGDKGEFRIQGLTPGAYTLVLRRLGYTSVRRSVTIEGDGTVELDLALAPAATPLEEVVTTVTGPQRRLELGNSIGVIKADSLVKEAPITTLSQLLSSRVPGLSVTQAQGTVGGNIKLQIRGMTTISQSNEPIVIIDGIRYNSRPASAQVSYNTSIAGGPERESVSPLNDLNPNDIETVDIVKGPSAATLYGTDATNGVIVITTKRGKAGPMQWAVHGSRDYNEIPRRKIPQDEVYYGWGQFPWGATDACRLYEMQAGDCTQDSVTHTTNLTRDPSLSVLKPSQSWTSGMSVSGGQPTLRYYAAANYNSLVGAIGIPDTALAIARANGRLNLPASFLRPNTQTQLNLQTNITASAGSKIDLTLSGGYVRGFTRTIDADFAPFNEAITQWDKSCRSCVLNKILNIFSRTANELNDRFTGSVNGTARLASWLSASGTVGFDWGERGQTEFLERDSTRESDPLGRAYERRTRSMVTSARGGATSNMSLGRIGFRSSIGTDYTRNTNDVVEALGTDLLPGTSSIVFAAEHSSNQSYGQGVTLGSYFEETVSLNERLFLTGAVRIDGATGFGENYRTASYPKISASWLLSQEPLLSNLPAVNDFRLRAAYGVSGQQAKSADKLPGIYIYPIDGYNQVVDISSIGNPSLRPERGSEFEYGFDAGLLGQRVQLGVTWYNRRTRDMIISEELSSGLGSVQKNIGLATGHGYEMNVTANVIETHPFSLSLTFGNSFNTTKLVDIGSALPRYEVAGGYVEGYPLGARFTSKFLGYDDENHDGLVSINEMKMSGYDNLQFIGVGEAPHQQNMNVNVGLLQQRVRLSALLSREAGGWNSIGYDCNRCRAAYDSTTSLDEQAGYLLTLLAPPMAKADFVRLREITAAWTIPARLRRFVRASSSTVSLSARNLALWTSYPGPDPESTPIERYAPTYQRETHGIPQARTYTLRFDLGL